MECLREFVRVQDLQRRSLAENFFAQQNDPVGIAYLMERIPIVYRNTFNHVNMRTHDAILY